MDWSYIYLSFNDNFKLSEISFKTWRLLVKDIDKRLYDIRSNISILILIETNQDNATFC